MLTATGQKPHKSFKGDITHRHIAWMSTWCWVISPFNDFCGFRSVAVNILDKLQFLICIFAVLLPNLRNCVITEYIKHFFDSQFRGCPPYKIVEKSNVNFTSFVAWQSGRTSVSGQRTFPVLRSTCCWWVTTNIGKPSAIGQPTRPTQPFILSRSINWVVSWNRMCAAVYR